ncbi:hypothetical protein [uncultured Muriicola sp.]|uniref:hypothetical protein n=1 Tax=uncultured Muriicola sp. TaxID=1583102 RepID=UPI002637F9D2|nr:hypothetical protein [uncultured Muriicola sp.]
MKQDLREIFKAERVKKHQLKEGHEARFTKRLEEAFPETKRSRFYLFGIAASVVVLVGLSFVFFQNTATEEPAKTVVIPNKPVHQGISLGDLSPDLKLVETYYVNSINLELASLEMSPDNKVVVDDFMGRISELNKEYNLLNNELNEVGPNEQTIGALIKNLQLRLQLLLKLKEKLHQLKSSENETATTNNA